MAQLCDCLQTGQESLETQLLGSPVQWPTRAGFSGAGVYQTLSLPPTQLLLDATRTSVIEVPQNGASLGEYMCTASYHTDTGLYPSSVTGTFILEAQCK